jgi:ring-1,2-phenylacetyl-CoA epoxidase subunit PaaD
VSAVAETLDRPSLDEVWAWLAEVLDPEIPAVSVVDLGIVRALRWEGDTLVVTVTPTYSGCPATAVIAFEIEAALRARGVADLRIARQLAPAWSTAAITPEGRAKLRAYGVAPPLDAPSCAGALAAPAAVACPRCGSGRTERVSQFGSTPCKASWRCLDCLEPFDHFKSF